MARFLVAALCLGLLPAVSAAQGNSPDGSAPPPPPAHDDSSAPQAVGEAPPEDNSGPDVASVLEERGLLTPSGEWVIEPSIQYNQVSSLTVAIDGFTLIPALAIGLIDVSEVQRDTITAALSFRVGLSRRLELGIRVPYVWRHESLRGREVLVGSDLDRITSSDGEGLGDVEFGIHYQFNRTVTGKPFFIGNLRAKSRTGTAPYEVESRQIRNDQGAVLGEILTEQPTGSGFWSVQPSLTMIFPTDPAVIFANISYLANLKRDIGEGRGWIDPGDAAGLSFGMGIALNDRVATSFGYDHNVVFRTRRQFDAGLDPVFDRFHIGTLLWGLSYRLSARSTLNVSTGIGVTASAPDVQLSVRLPMKF
jgi:hypothetical protein